MEPKTGLEGLPRLLGAFCQGWLRVVLQYNTYHMSELGNQDFTLNSVNSTETHQYLQLFCPGRGVC